MAMRSGLSKSENVRRPAKLHPGLRAGRGGLLVHLISHKRPVAEIPACRHKPLAAE